MGVAPSEVSGLLPVLFSNVARYVNGGELKLWPIPSSPETERFLRQSYVDSLLWLPQGEASPAQRLYKKLWQVHRAAFLEFVEACTAVGIEPTVLKGVEFTETLLRGFPVGYMADIDVLVEHEEIPRVRSVLCQLGYVQGRFNRDSWTFKPFTLREVAQIELTHYELAPHTRMATLDLTEDELEIAREIPRNLIWTRDGQAQFEIMIDVHHALSTDIETCDGVEETVAGGFPGTTTLSDTDHFWLTCAKFYAEVAMHGKRQLRDFVYLVALIARGRIDWERLKTLSDKIGLGPSIYYYTQISARLGNLRLPENFETQFDPRLGSRARDWGWQWGVLVEELDPPPALCTSGTLYTSGTAE